MCCQGNLCLEMYAPSGFQILYILQRTSFPSILFFTSSLLLHHFFLSIDISTASRTTRPLRNDLERRTHGSSLLLIVLPIFFLPWLTFAFCIIAPFFFVDWVAIAWHHYSFACSPLLTSTDSFSTAVTSSPFLHSVAQYTRLVIPRQVIHLV
jgi:hypothetical protein